MRTLSASELLSVWERGFGQALFLRAQTMLHAVYPEAASEQLAAMSVGRRDAVLLKLRERTFGSSLTATTRCPNCGDLLELAFDVADVLVARTDTEFPDDEPESLALQVGDYAVRFRAPTTQDLLATSTIADAEEARQAVLQRCLIEIRHGELPSDAPLPAEVAAEVVHEMERADSQANTVLALRCPQCAHDWEAEFDVVSFLWKEINNWAQHVVREVHVLASRYGWSEADILSMSAARRQLYLEMPSG